MIEVDIEQFHEHLQNEIIADAQNRQLIRQQAFFENINEELIENGEISPNYDYAFYKNTGIEVNGYGHDENRQILFLTVNHYVEEIEVESINASSIETKFKRLKGFLHLIIAEKYNDIPIKEVFEMAEEIHALLKSGVVSKIRMFLLTNAKATRNLKVIDNENIAEFPIEFRVVDLDYLYRSYQLGASGGDIQIDTDIPSIEIPSNNNEYSSYLGVLTGEQITDIYEQYGQKLFEQNVRTFLQFRANVNKGLRETIRNKPERFFAYNNGITATASEVKIENGKIKHISGLQIVNGGQTTSAIYYCFKKEKLDVSKVSVQMKLSVIEDKEKHGNFVSKVSEYANTQNKINKADFFSNSPFHTQFKDLSKVVLAKPSDGGQRKTRWYYERVRGEYLNDQAYLTSSKKRQFQEDWPKSQKIDKTFISKSEISWEQMPNIVSKGASYSFDKFADLVTNKIEDNELAITEAYYKEVIGRVIMFRALEKLISKADWYENGFRAQTVTYTLAYFSKSISDTGNYFDFEQIWDIQSIPSTVENIFKETAKQVYASITNPPSGSANIAQWCKNKECWNKVLNDVDVTIPSDSKFLMGQQTARTVQREAQVLARMDDGIKIQSFVLDRKNRKIWAPLYEYYKNDNEMSPMKMDILHKFATGLMPMPSEKQSRIIYDLYMDAADRDWEP